MQGVRIDFDNVRMSVQTKKGSKPILKSISGRVMPGRLTALLGPSGSGKTSLLNVLAARTAVSKGLVLSGSVSVDGQLVTDWNAYRQQVAYVEQDDLMFHTLTVKETLQLAAQLRLPRELSFADKMSTVDEVINELGLRKCEDTRIGNAKTRGVSGGERKRTSIALAILRSPTVLFLDECTSGLDSFGAMRVVTTIKHLAEHGGRTVVTSIHQPRSSIFSQFDDLIIVSEGRMMYFGKACEMTAYFDGRLGLALPVNFNPGDFVLDLVSLDVRTELLEQHSRERLDRIALEATQLSPKSVALDDEDQETTTTRLTSRRKYEATMSRQFWLLGRRAFVQKTRDRDQYVPQLATSVLFGMIIGFVYFQNGKNLAQNAVQDKAGLMFFICLNQGFNGMFQQIQTFPIERDIIQRERACNSYSVAPYFFSKTLADLPNLTFPFVFITLTYWIAGFPDNASVFFQTAFLTMLIYFTSGSFGLVCSAAMDTPEAAQALAMPFQLVFALFSGFYANSDLIPRWLFWIQYISPIRWGYAGMLNVVMGDMVFTCDDAQAGCIATGKDYIANFGLSEDSFERSVGVLLGLAVLFQVIGCTVLVFRRVKWKLPVPTTQEEVAAGNKAVEEDTTVEQKD
ncbi:hypothetical protein BASA81_008668 [Batrachochytrium salamandrivorans]|nr:hypothetical protein BASA81_008668 [Batrachochytrium salamandrivorans]